MVRATALILMAGIEFPHFNEVKTSSSWMQLTDTCEVKIPRGLLVDGRPLKEKLKVRDAVTVDLGYDGHNDRIFTGVVAQSLSPTVPVEIKCEDPMFLLKQNRVTYQWRDASLKDIVAHVAPGLEYKILDAEIGKYTIPEDWNAAKVFNDLKSNYGLYAFFREGKLQVGLQYDPAYAKTKTFDFEMNGADGVGYVVENNLEFFTKEDLRLKVKAISIGKNNKKTTVEVGDSEGENRTMHFYDLSEMELKAAAERELERMRYDGYRGSFTTFGKPFVRHGDIVKLIDNRYDRSGKYWVDKVEYEMTLTGGYRQIIHLGPIT